MRVQLTIIAATSHRIQAAGAVKHKYQCPIVDANRKDLKMSAARMGKLKSYDTAKSETKEERRPLSDDIKE